MSDVIEIDHCAGRSGLNISLALATACTIFFRSVERPEGRFAHQLPVLIRRVPDLFFEYAAKMGGVLESYLVANVGYGVALAVVKQ